MIDMFDQTPYKKPRTVITPEDVALILELYSCGMPVTTIAAKFITSTTTIYTVIKRNTNSEMTALKNRIRELELACGIKTKP